MAVTKLLVTDYNTITQNLIKCDFQFSKWVFFIMLFMLFVFIYIGAL